MLFLLPQIFWCRDMNISWISHSVCSLIDEYSFFNQHFLPLGTSISFPHHLFTFILYLRIIFSLLGRKHIWGLQILWGQQSPLLRQPEGTHALLQLWPQEEQQHHLHHHSPWASPYLFMLRGNKGRKIYFSLVYIFFKNKCFSKLLKKIKKKKSETQPPYHKVLFWRQRASNPISSFQCSCQAQLSNVTPHSKQLCSLVAPKPTATNE